MVKIRTMASKYVFRFLMSLGLLVFLLMQMDWAVLGHTAANSNLGLLILSVVLVLSQIFFLNLRWHSYLNAGRESVPFSTSVLINIAGYFANVIFITSVGGVLAKSALAIRHGISVVHAVFATFLDRFMTLAALIFFSALGLPFLQDTIDSRILYMLGVSIIFIVLCIALVLLGLRSGMLKNFILSSRRRSRVIATLRMVTENYPLMAKTAVHSIIAQMFFILSVYVLAVGLETPIASPIEFLALLPILALIASLPISFGGWGVREGSFVYGLGLIGFSMEEAFLLSVQVGLVTLIAPFLVVLPYFLKDNLKSLFIKPSAR